MARLLRIEICDQCDHRGRYDDRCYGVYPHREFDDKCKPEIPDWCPLPEASGWIPVGERLPESGVEILVLGEYWPVGFTPGVHLADYLAERAVSPWLSRCGERLFSVTHWRALPSLPEAEEATNDDATE